MIMSIKRYLRQKLDYVKTRLSIAKLYYADCKYNIKYHRGTCEDSKDKSDANIMLVMHALEKGMSFSSSAGSREFGGAKAISLVPAYENILQNLLLIQRLTKQRK